MIIYDDIIRVYDNIDTKMSYMILIDNKLQQIIFKDNW